MRTVRRFFSTVPKYLLWLVISTVLWMWIFGLITDTTPARKVVLYANVAELADPELAIELETELPDGIRMIKAHNSTYFMFDSNAVVLGDFFVLPTSAVEEYISDYCPISPADFPEAKGFYEADGTCYGILVYDAETGEGVASGFIRYYDPEGDAPNEDFYLLFNTNSLHCGEQDEAAFQVARHLLRLP